MYNIQIDQIKMKVFLDKRQIKNIEIAKAKKENRQFKYAKKAKEIKDKIKQRKQSKK